MMALGSWWMQESKFPPPLSEFVQNMDGFDFFYLPPVKDGNPASPPVGGIDIGYGLTKNGAKNPAAWTFLAELTNGVGPSGGAERPQRSAGLRRPRAEGRRHRACQGDVRRASWPICRRPRTSASRLRPWPRRSTTRSPAWPPAAWSREAALATVQAATDKALGKQLGAARRGRGLLPPRPPWPGRAEHASHDSGNGRGARLGGLAPARTSHGLYLFALPATLLFVVFIAYPILWVAGQSLWTEPAGHRAFGGLPTTAPCSPTRPSGSWCATWSSGASSPSRCRC